MKLALMMCVAFVNLDINSVSATPLLQLKALSESEIHQTFLENKCSISLQFIETRNEPLDENGLEYKRKERETEIAAHLNNYFLNLEKTKNDTQNRKFQPVKVIVTNPNKKHRYGYIFEVEICPFEMDPSNIPKHRRRPDPTEIPTTTTQQTTSDSALLKQTAREMTLSEKTISTTTQYTSPSFVSPINSTAKSTKTGKDTSHHLFVLILGIIGFLVVFVVLVCCICNLIKRF
ncbi:hypothetical protein M3Y97_00507200 [Aphelenchoides bicaudatus]|nr:hypothetical protein M3Y97_00507200 [Aphelenchoides bicaudatus]